MIKILKKIFGRSLEDKASDNSERAIEVKKENKKSYSLEDVREKTRNIPKSSCGCYRHGARNLFYQEKNDNPERTLALYEIVSPSLHSYCNSTRSSYSSNNDCVLRDAFFASMEVISYRKGNLEDTIRLNYRIIRDLNENLGHSNIVINRIGSDCATNLIKEAINFANDNRSYEALLILRNAEELAKIIGDKSANEVTTDLKKSYLKKTIKEISNLKDLNDKAKKLYCIGNFVFSCDKTGLKFIRTSNNLSSLTSRNKNSEERLTERVSHYYSYNKISPSEIRYRNINSNLNKDVEKVRNESENQRKSLSEKIKYLENFQNGLEILNKRVDYEHQLDSLGIETENKIDGLNRQYRMERNQLENEIDLVRKERDEYVAKIKSRILTNPEYKSLLTKMRFKERK